MDNGLERALANLKGAVENGPAPERVFDASEIAGLAIARAERKESNPSALAVMEAAKEWKSPSVSSAEWDMVREEVRRRLSFRNQH